MKYALLGYRAPDALDRLTDVERAAWEVDDAAFRAELARRQCVVHCEPLADADTATTVQVVNGQMALIDGAAYAELGDVLVIDVPDLDSALDLARRSPAARVGVIEVRPIRRL
ncbi:MAG: uncharacterized protein JWL70_719 [Acidimicrobiia bacterium]|nr:uncharacterized protein [Acidimicrobiia bacterium]